SDAAYSGSSEVAMPLLVASACTLLVLTPLALMPGMGQFLFKPMALAVAFAMVSAYLLSLSLVPVRCAAWLRATPGSQAPYDAPAPCGDPRHDDDLLYHAVDLDRLAAPKRKSFTDVWTAWYLRRFAAVMADRSLTVAIATLLLVAVVGGLGPQLRREFFPEVDGATFEAYVRAPTGTRIDTLRGAEAKVARLEGFFREQLGDDIEIMISE